MAAKKKQQKTHQNRVGHYVPTPDEVADIHAKINDVIAFARKLGPQLSTTERKRINHPRKDGDTIATDLTHHARQFNISSRLLTPDGADADAAVQRSIRAITQDAFTAWSALRDVYIQARGERWDAALYFYGALAQAAKNDPEIFTAISPIIDFFATGPRATTDDSHSNTPDDADDEALN
jgi:hypothetical protein